MTALQYVTLVELLIEKITSQNNEMEKALA